MSLMSPMSPVPIAATFFAPAEMYFPFCGREVKDSECIATFPTF